MKHFDVAIVGGGIAGLVAAMSWLRQLNPLSFSSGPINSAVGQYLSRKTGLSSILALMESSREGQWMKSFKI
nr:hypothetical protein [Paenibacillus xerothermodurans]